MNISELIAALERNSRSDDIDGPYVDGVSQELEAELVRLARLGLEAEQRTKTHEDRCVAFVATLQRALEADKATFKFYSFDGLSRVKIEASSFSDGFKGEGHGPLEALDDAIEADGYVP